MPPWPVGASLLNQNFVTFDEPTKTGAANLTVSGVGCAVLAASSAAAAAAHGRSGIQRIVGGSDRANINFVGRWASVAPLLRVSIPLHVAMYLVVPGDDSKTLVFLYTQPRAKPIFTDGLRVPAGYTESVLLTFALLLVVDLRPYIQIRIFDQSPPYSSTAVSM